MAKRRSAAKFMASSTETSGAQPAGGKKHARDFWTEKDVSVFTPLSGGKSQRALSLAVTQEQIARSLYFGHIQGSVVLEAIPGALAEISRATCLSQALYSLRLPGFLTSSVLWESFFYTIFSFFLNDK